MAAITALYRISSGEVYKISPKGQPFADRDSAFWEVLNDPTFSDGVNTVNYTVDPVTGKRTPVRTLSIALIADVAGNDVKLAIQSEINTFSSSEIDDLNQIDADRAGKLFDTHPQFRKAFIAFAKVVMDEINILRQQHSLPDRTISQLKTALQNKIDKND